MTVLPSSVAAARNFSRAADRYAQWAVPQRSAADHLAGLLAPHHLDGPALDIGCGTGFLVEALRRRSPALPIHAIDVAPGMVAHCRKSFAGHDGLSFEVADIQGYTPGAHHPLVVSNCCLQWVEDQRTVLARIASFRPATLALAVPVRGSLPELTSAYRSTMGRDFPGLVMASAEEYQHWCAAVGLKVRHAGTRTMGHWLRDGMEALRALRIIGATFGGHGRHARLSPAEVRALASVYTDLHHQPGRGVPQTYQILFLLAEAPDG